jgi:hypothetical protein
MSGHRADHGSLSYVNCWQVEDTWTEPKADNKCSRTKYDLSLHNFYTKSIITL